MQPLPTIDGGWQVILADPPWHFASNSDERPGRNARRHYATMKIRDIEALPVKSVLARDALLLLWTTVPHQHLAFGVVRAWGFRPVSGVVWVKQRRGPGYWARNRHEPLIIAKRGKFPCPVPTLFPDSVIEGQQREHSRKPDAVHERVDAVLGDARKLEMFGRESRPGWTVWGNETGKFDQESEEP